MCPPRRDVLRPSPREKPVSRPEGHRKCEVAQKSGRPGDAHYLLITSPWCQEQPPEGSIESSPDRFSYSRRLLPCLRGNAYSAPQGETVANCWWPTFHVGGIGRDLTAAGHPRPRTSERHCFSDSAASVLLHARWNEGNSKHHQAEHHALRSASALTYATPTLPSELLA
jgi:hypothetical protein